MIAWYWLIPTFASGCITGSVILALILRHWIAGLSEDTPPHD